MYRTFQSRVSAANQILQVQIVQNRPSRLWRALLWSAGWIVIAYACRRLGHGTLSVAGFIVSSVFCVIGLVFANYSVSRNDVCLTPDTFRLRTTRLISRKTRSFPLSAVSNFGFGYFSHGGPVLKFEVGGRWFVLAEGVYERDVDDLLQRIAECGYSIPR